MNRFEQVRDRFLDLSMLDAAPTVADRAPRDAAVPVLIIPKPVELSWWDWAVFLLHTAAEIEHILMVQYLYAAYSLADADFTGGAVPADAAERTGRWRDTVTQIAREEMAHLLTEQNLLLFIGGPLNVIDRQDFPFRSTLYPFPLQLAPMSKDSLATYVAAEMPAAPAAPDIDEVIDRATHATGGFRPNRVGVLFDTLVDVFADPAKLPDTDFRPQTAVDQQAQSDDWFGFFGPLIIRTISTRQQAVDALRDVGEQGEGPQTPEPGDPPSHFDQFLAIYREFPETGSATPDWIPTRSVPTNPSTGTGPDPDPEVERGRITHPTSRLWAALGNVRYRMLLVDLVHALLLTGPLNATDGSPTPRGHLRDWAFLQMRGAGFSGLRGIAQLLMTRPAKAEPMAGDPSVAGPAFEVPYTSAVPADEHGRWRLQLALLDGSAELITRLRAAGETGELLDELVSIDEEARVIVTARLAATAGEPGPTP